MIIFRARWIIPFLLLCQFQAISQNADINLLDKINNGDISSGTYNTFHFITKSAPIVGFSVPVVLFAAGLIEGNEPMKMKAGYVFESMVVSWLVTYGLKYAVNRQRPFITYPFIVQKSSAGSSPSFPSGHTSYIFSMATSLSIAYPRWYVIVPSMVYASAVGYSRMYLGVHYPSDVLAGALVGVGSAYLTYKINAWIHHSRHNKLSVSW